MLKDRGCVSRLVSRPRKKQTELKCQQQHSNPPPRCLNSDGARSRTSARESCSEKPIRAGQSLTAGCISGEKK